MQETEIVFPQEFYKRYLSTIGYIHFTHRELDIMACLLKGHSTGKMALFLSVAKNTIETHKRNIMSKIKCHTREGIVDFVEQSDKIHLLEAYYRLLKTEALFIKSLKCVSKLVGNKKFHCCLIQEQKSDSFLLQLHSYLNLSGITAFTTTRERQEDCTLFIFPKPLTKKISSSFISKILQSKNKPLLLLHEGQLPKDISQGISNYDFVNFTEKNCFLSFFSLLLKLLPHLDLKEIITDFKKEYHKIYFNSPSLQPSLNVYERKNFFQDRRWFYYFFVSLLSVLALSGGFFFYEKPKQTIRPELDIPTESAFLNRPEIMSQIDNTFKGEKGIQSTALVGIGGAGKTIIARQYAHQQKANIVWKMNAETLETLKNSFERFAENLSKTEEDKKLLREIQEIKDSSVREEKVIEFVKVHLQSCPNWFLIYDNMEEAADIQKYLPQDPLIWGTGKVLLTSRNTNIQNNSHIGHVIVVGELNQQQKSDLFTKIMRRGASNDLAAAQKAELQKFLEHIPSFPLDVSVAAYYIKSTNISYDSYLENLKNYTHEFSDIQKSLLKEAGDYFNTRYGIITLSLEQLFKEHKDFGELLLLIGMLDSQNIPRDLLSKHKDKVVIDNFIYHLNKYSLITNDPVALTSNLTFSIHRSAQNIILSYTTKKLDLSQDTEILQKIHDSFSNYIVDAIERGDFFKMKFLSLHCIAWLSHDYLLTNLMRASISGELGGIYCHQGLYENAKKCIEESLAMLDKEKNPILYNHASIYLGKFYIALGDYKKAAHLFENNLAVYKKNSIIHRDLLKTLTYLGTIYRKIGNYTKAQEHLEKCFSLYKTHFPESPVLMPWTSISLGNLYLDQGKYEKAKAIFEDTLKIYQKNFSENHIAAAEIFQRLGVIYREQGHYDKAISLLENSIKSYRQDLSKNHIYVAQPLVYLGSVYIELGEHQKAKEILEKSIAIYNTHVAKNNVLAAWALGYLGNVYKNLKNYQLAKNYLQNNLSIYENQYGKGHIKTAGVLRDLGRVYLLEEDTQAAEAHLVTALEIFEKNNHPESYTCLESLADLYQRQYNQALAKQRTSDAQQFHNKTIQSLNSILQIINMHFPEGSPHRLRIQEKIQKAARKNSN